MLKQLSALFAALALLSSAAFAQVPPQWTYSNQNGSPVAAYQGNVLAQGNFFATGGMTATGGVNTFSTLTVTSTAILNGGVTLGGGLVGNGGLNIAGTAVFNNGLSGSGTATFATGAAAGTGPSIACTASRLCDSISGTVTLTTGTATTTGTLATITLPITRATAPNCSVKIKGVSGASYTDSETTSTIVLTDVVALAISTAFTVSYVCGGV